MGKKNSMALNNQKCLRVKPCFGANRGQRVVFCQQLEAERLLLLLRRDRIPALLHAAEKVNRTKHWRRRSGKKRQFTTTLSQQHWPDVQPTSLVSNKLHAQCNVFILHSSLSYAFFVCNSVTLFRISVYMKV